MTPSTPAIGLLAAVPWRPVAGLAATGLALLLAATVWAAAPIADLATRVGLVALAASAAHVLDEAAAEAVAATPTSLRTRTMTRSACAAVALTLGVSGLGAVALASDGPDRPAVAVQLAGSGLVALALAALLRRRLHEPGDLAAAGVTTAVLVLSLAGPLDRWVVLFPTRVGEGWAASVAAWSLIALACAVVLVQATRDPFDRQA
ncbi:hypothetical protein [Terrabacter sp. 2RAF25]|uniref:hypothetical protein n=1 Tax=Terrabacter sp. 2RAF25 TaxID=3232998 RepID=UPI003F9B5966